MKKEYLVFVPVGLGILYFTYQPFRNWIDGLIIHFAPVLKHVLR